MGRDGDGRERERCVSGERKRVVSGKTERKRERKREKERREGSVSGGEIGI